MNIPGYDEWKLRGPDEDAVEIGYEYGEVCNRFPEPDEDHPRSYRPRRCTGIMEEVEENVFECNRCGEAVEVEL
tara:strand:- start:2061 stop:2282 length:222 start_codon:yes stop_codon:yes gene_type:complete